MKRMFLNLSLLLQCTLGASSLANRDIISIEDLSRDEIDLILDTAAHFKAHPQPHLLDGLVVASCFFEPSTRTRLSFESAASRLGGSVIGFSDGENTSIAKGESLSDTIRCIGGFADLIVIRHPEKGSAAIAAQNTDKPVINGGDGSNQHPTQTLVDLFTMRESRGNLDDIHIAFVGDLKYGRTVHSLSLALAHYRAHLYFVSPPSLSLPEELVKTLQSLGLSLSYHTSLEEVLPHVDFLYMTRIQKERFQDKSLKHPYLITPDHLSIAQSHLKILHPLPRNEEIDPALDSTPNAIYFQQMANGVPVRMALLALLLDKL